MQLADRINPQAGVERLELALRQVLGESYEIELRATVESSVWYREELPSSEAFRLWICDNLERQEDPQWIFQPVRANERKFLCDALGISRSEIIGKSPRQLAGLVMHASGLPSQDLAGVLVLQGIWRENHTLVLNDEDERAAVLCRQRGERLLRELLVFYCGLGYGEYFVQVLKEPGKLRVPTKLLRPADAPTPEERSSRIVEAFMDDSLADLGFLSMALRKFSVKIEEAGEKHINGEDLRILNQKEFDAFGALSTALQPYHHDKPSQLHARRSNLLSAISEVQLAIETMDSRRIVPDEMVVTEASCATPFGRAFRGLVDSGRIRCLTTDTSPSLGQRIRFIASADRDYARCKWRVSNW